MQSVATKQFLEKLFAQERARLASLAAAAPAAKRASWKDDAAAWVTDARKDPAVAAAIDAAAAERAAEKARKEQYARELAASCANWHVWRKATPYVLGSIMTHPGVLGNDKGWEKEPTFTNQMVPNRTRCPYCKGC